jgi:hypothetical protein
MTAKPGANTPKTMSEQNEIEKLVAPQEGEKLLRNLSIFTAAIVTVSGAIQGWSSLRINQALEETKRTQVFSRQILDQMDNLTNLNTVKGRVSLVGLYVIAASEKDKLNIVNIALQSGSQELQDTAALLINQDCQSEPSMELCRNAKQLLAQAVDRNVQTKAREQEGWQPAIVPLTALNQTMEKLTATRIHETGLQGWIYLGKTNSNGELQQDRTTTVRRVPSPPYGLATTMTAVYLRDKGSARSGECLGILPSGQPVRIWALRSSSIPHQAPGTKALWAKISTTTTGAGR